MCAKKVKWHVLECLKDITSNSIEFFAKRTPLKIERRPKLAYLKLNLERITDTASHVMTCTNPRFDICFRSPFLKTIFWPVLMYYELFSTSLYFSIYKKDRLLW